MNNLCCWLVTCRPGTSVLVTVVKRPIWPAHAAARGRRVNAYVAGRTKPTVGLAQPPVRPAIRSCRRPAIRAVAEDFTTHSATATHTYRARSAFLSHTDSVPISVTYDSRLASRLTSG